MERLGAWITANTFIIMAAAVLLTLLSIHFAGQIEMQGMNTENFVGKDSPLYQVYDHLYLENFGTESIVVLVEGDDVAKKEVLKAALRFSDQMKDAPHVLGIQGIADTVASTEAVRTGVRGIPDQTAIDEDLTSIDPKLLIGIMPDRRHMLISVSDPTYITDKQRNDLLAEIQKAVDTADFPPDYGVTVTGSPALMTAIVAQMNNSNGQILGLAVVLMVLALLLVFRHVRWSLMPIPIVFLGIIWTFGAMGLLHIPMTMVSFSAFPLLIGIGIDYAIQFHNRIEEEVIKGMPPVQAAINTVNHVAVPVIIALVVTVAGFVALLSSSVPMIRDFGILCIIGLIMCYLSSLFLGVSVLYLAEKRYGTKGTKGLAGSDEGSAIGKYLAKIADFCIRRWQMVLVIALLLALMGNYFDAMVPVETDTKNYIPQDLPPLVVYRHMQTIFGGTDSIQFLIQADDITDPGTLRWMDDFGIYLTKSRDQVYGATSIATYIKGANGGTIPNDRTAIRNIISSLPKAVQDKYLSGHNLAIIDVNIGTASRDLGVEGITRLIREFDKDLAWMTPPPEVSVKETGQSVVMTTTMSALTTGRAEMSLLGLVLIFCILLVIYRGDLIKALLPVLPMLVVIGWMGGIMYLGGLKYTPLTATLGALVLGVGSEYAILMMERFYEELNRVGDPFEALTITASRIGSALVASGATTTFGFGALIASPFNITNNFGLVTVMAVIFALLTTFTVFVVLMLRMEIRREVMENARAELMKALKFMKADGNR